LVRPRLERVVTASTANARCTLDVLYMTDPQGFSHVARDSTA